ncbi:CDP-glucose 4,6-dehydratase [Primorskyibacter flagellatus]|uniref:CDP-glucose 4,6-dehydratase n=1 Tax=Primorskyibacter flagellatus TaxID=1387277 RepID=A0A917EGL6_9RHOB|nr:CDP-glucose 4,6-dehydratase [Primorskyibacter flagellatus]GGE33305.1 CDP-glucose 4,6-dehydratase [Primorskyibacter flagellatus]
MEGLVTPGFWSGKSVLVTGHTGFKGAWLCHWLTGLGAKVSGIALPPETTPNLFDILRIGARIDRHILCDIRDRNATAEAVAGLSPEIVFHMAAQPIVRRAHAEPAETFDTNVMGTVNLLEALRPVPALKTIVAITTDKVYDNREWPWPYRETDPLGGHEPYGASKAAAEMVISAYRASYFEPTGRRLIAVRAGNVIGGGDWSDFRIVPDIVNAFASRSPLVLRNPDATRPWQHVFEPLAGYMRLAEQLHGGGLSGATAYNFGPDPADTRSVVTLVRVAATAWGGDCDIRIEPDATIRESQLLTLDNSLVRTESGWTPTWGFDACVAETMAWYRAHLDGADMIDFSNDQLGRFIAAAEQGQP